MNRSRRPLVQPLAAVPLCAAAQRSARAAGEPILVGIDGELSLHNSRSAQARYRPDGALVPIDEPPRETK